VTHSLIDLHHLGNDRSIGCYLLETDDGPALFDCGPASTVAALKTGLAQLGVELTDVRHLLLSHIHLDHAGAAGTLVREHPGLQVHVSERGAPHLVDPGRLEGSARRLYGELFDTLWGELAPVPEANVHVVGDATVGLETFPTPGHAWHHVSYLDADGTLYCGDAAGVRIRPGAYVRPPTPPPDIDVEQWLLTIDELERRTPQRLALVHFGVFEDVPEHLGRMKEELARFTEIVGRDVDAEEFEREALEALPPAERQLYEHAVPLAQCYLGLRRYWDKKREAAAQATGPARS
jgi:glyoxylase-like metal-dependent hydrolase (beta-lactamase superfamily II)